MFELTNEMFNPFASADISPPYNQHWESKRRLAQALRNLCDVAVTSDADPALLDDISARLEAMHRELSQHPRCPGTLAFLDKGEFGSYGVINHELNAVGGPSNPLAPNLNIWLEGSGARGMVRCGYAYEGPPGFVHGGFVAAIFDQFLGMTQIAGGRPGMTGSLSVRYLRPTPLNTDLQLSATLGESDGRKTTVTGEMRANDEVVATAQALFIEPRRPIPELGRGD